MGFHFTMKGIIFFLLILSRELIIMIFRVNRAYSSQSTAFSLIRIDSSYHEIRKMLNTFNIM